MNTSLFSKTPTVAVLDNRGLTVRNIAYHRSPDSPEITTERITYHSYNNLGFLTQSADPRLHEAGLSNFTWLMDLSGNILRTQGVDNGTTVSLNDAAGRPFIEVSNISTADDGTDDRSQALTRTWQYEDTSLTGRPLSVTELVKGEVVRITERFVYAGKSEAEKSRNLAGLCVSHYDTAGLELTDSVSLTGVPLSVTRCLLKNADDPEVIADWQGEDTSAWNDKLAAETFTILTSADAIGAVLTTTDAIGNVQRVAYDVAGLLTGSWLTLKDGTEKIIVKSLTYSAAGQKLREEHGNGVVTTYTYEPETQRLTGIKTERPVGHASGARVLQDLRYEYDPVGNVLKVSNDAEETRFWRNQKIVPENTFTYDSLYQLVGATGREIANAGQQGSDLPIPSTPLSTNDSIFTNYTRTYIYDSSSNLMRVRHTPATGSGYTTDITISERSNRGVLSTLTEIPSEVDALFTTGGQQIQLQPGQTLLWTPRKELRQVTPVVRDGYSDDRENYRYNGSSQRILKVNVQKTGNSTRTQRVIYLPGLELHTINTGSTETERLQVICAGVAGRAQVRVLHWEAGLPSGIDANNQIRWSYDNMLDSSSLEVDETGNLISMEEYYPYGGTAVWIARNQSEADYKTFRYSGKERDATGLYYYGYRYYQPWVGRWLSADPLGYPSGVNLFCMVGNNPVSSKDIAGLIRAEDLPDSVLLAIGYKQGPYTEEQYRLYGYRDDGQRGLVERGWVDDARINTHSPEIFVAAHEAHNELLQRSKKGRDFERLTVDEKAIIFLYSQESIPFHEWTANHNLGRAVQEKYREAYHPGQTGELARALEKLPAFKGTTYRGALLTDTFYAENEEVARQYQQANPNVTVFEKGSLVTTHGFFSTSASPEVASQFVFRQRFGKEWSADTVLFNITGRSGRNIAELTELEQAEILLLPSSTFRVSGVTRTDFGYHVNLLEVDAGEAWTSGVEIRDYQRGYTKGRRPTTANY